MEHQPVNIKQSKIHILDDSEEERKNILEEIIAKIFPSLLREKRASRYKNFNEPYTG